MNYHSTDDLRLAAMHMQRVTERVEDMINFNTRPLSLEEAHYASLLMRSVCGLIKQLCWGSVRHPEDVLARPDAPDILTIALRDINDRLKGVRD